MNIVNSTCMHVFAYESNRTHSAPRACVCVLNRLEQQTNGECCTSTQRSMSMSCEVHESRADIFSERLDEGLRLVND